MGPKLCMRTQAMVLLALCSIQLLFFVDRVSLNKGPGRVDLFGYVFDVCVPVDDFFIATPKYLAEFTNANVCPCMS